MAPSTIGELLHWTYANYAMAYAALSDHAMSFGRTHFMIRSRLLGVFAMIKLKQPSLVLHSCDVPGYKYQMWQSWKMPKGARPKDVVYWILYARDRTPELWLRNVVINCHGLDGKLYVGGDGQPTINNYNVSAFSELKGKDLGTIWLVACKVANTGIGKYFCEHMAQLAGCSVVAADANQYVETGSCPWGCVDNYEGHTFEWDGSGKKSPVGQDGAGIPGVA